MEEIIKYLASTGIGGIIATTVAYLFFKSYIPSYLGEKGKNLATKEDIEDITDTVESVKTEYAKELESIKHDSAAMLEEMRTNNQLMLFGIEREKTLKKEVYLNAVQAITENINVFLNIPDLNIKDEYFTKIISKNSGAISKIQLVGNEDTISSVNKISHKLSSAILKLLLPRADLLIKKLRIELLEKEREKAIDEINRYTSIIKDMTVSKDFDKWRKNIIDENSGYERNKSLQLSDAINELRDSLLTDQINFSRECMEYYYELSSDFPAAILSIRKELDLNISEEEYINNFQKLIEETKKSLEEFLIGLEFKIKNTDNNS